MTKFIGMWKLHLDLNKQLIIDDVKKFCLAKYLKAACHCLRISPCLKSKFSRNCGEIFSNCRYADALYFYVYYSEKGMKDEHQRLTKHWQQVKRKLCYSNLMLAAVK